MCFKRPILETIHIYLTRFFFCIQFQFLSYLIGKWNIISEIKKRFRFHSRGSIVLDALMDNPRIRYQVSDSYEEEDSNPSKKYLTDFFILISLIKKQDI
ncbi:TPA: hypothetical protein DCZ39_03790 [Patescibacteria group bacterium]|nr:hypothetical protein [Candidatus Gracilibacteria bacterium]